MRSHFALPWCRRSPGFPSDVFFQRYFPQDRLRRTGQNVKQPPGWAAVQGAIAGLVARSAQFLIQRQGEEVGELRASGHLLEDLRGLVELARRAGGFDLGEFLRDDRAHQIGSDFAAVAQHALGALNPLPHLAARDFGGGRVFHQIVDGHGAAARQPRAEVVDADVDVVA